MPNPVWPLDLPQDQFYGLSRSYPDDTTLRFAVDAGPAKVRPRYTAAPSQISPPLVLTNPQAQSLDTFWRSTLKTGALEFDWTDPLFDTTVTMRFIQPPRMTMRPSAGAGSRRWEGVLVLEVLP